MKRDAILAVLALTAATCVGGGDSNDRSVVDATTNSTGDPSTVAPPSLQAPPAASPTAATPPSTGVAGSTSPVSASWFTPTLRQRLCPKGYPRNAECATFTVAADRDDSHSGTVQLPVVVLRATGAAPVSDALVIPAGGPGEPGAGALRWAGSPFNKKRDIVLYDQRGTGGAVPSLDCPAVDEAFVAALQHNRSYIRERDAIAAARDDCLAKLESAGVDLSDYHSEASAADLDELRQALGYRQWNLLGISYGGRLALATMRSYSDGIRAAILDSVYDVTYGGLASLRGRIERAFRRLARGCAADSTCSGAHGDLKVQYEQVRRRYNAEPVAVDVDLGDGNGPREFVITGDDMIAGLFNALYVASLIPLLPAIIDDLAAGDTGIVPALVQQGVPFATSAADAMTLAVNCADNAGLHTAVADAVVYDNPGRLSLVAASTGVCPPGWPTTPGEFNMPVTSPVPSLLLAGSYDPITPPSGTSQVAERLTNSTYVLVEPVGHGVTLYNQCVTRIELAFLDDPTADLDTSCTAAITPPAFQ